MLAVLGWIEFEPLTAPEKFRSRQGYTYARHDVVEGKPRLQSIGDELEEIKLRMQWHRSYCNPQMQVDLVRFAAESHAVLPLIWGNGIMRGFYVIEGIEEEINVTADDGSLICIECEVWLTEYSMSSAEMVEQETGDTPGIDPTNPTQPGISAGGGIRHPLNIPTNPDGTAAYLSISDEQTCRQPEYAM
jgi:phage protein U